MDQTQAPNEVQGPNMDQASHDTQAPNGTQGPNMAQASHETQAPNGTPVNEGQPLTEILTPFGSPIDPTSASLLAQNRLGWHLHYWRGLRICGLQRDVDPVLLESLIEAEQMLKLDPQLEQEMWLARVNNQSTIDEEVMQSCNEAILDIDRMLANKVQKMRVYLRGQERIMLRSLRAGDAADAAEFFFHKISDIYQILRAEEEKDAERVFSLEIPQWR